MANREVRSSEHLAGGPRSDERCEATLGSEPCDHLRGAGRVLVDQHQDTPMERHRAKTLRNEPHRAIPMPHFEPVERRELVEERRR